MKKSLLVCAAIFVAGPALAQSPGPGVIMPGDHGRWHGYMPAGYIGSHPNNRGPHSCTWSVTASCAAWRNGSYSRNGTEHRVIKRFPNGRYVEQVYHHGTRVK